MRRIAFWVMPLLAWTLLLVGLAAIALNPGVPSVRYALFWLGVMAIGRAVSLLVSWTAVAIDLSLLFICLVGLEIGGLILIPCLLAFAIADALPREWACAS